MEKKKLHVNILGRPNSGKSTIVNTVINKKITAVSRKAHTTSEIITGLYVEDNIEIIFLDTPGISYNKGSTHYNEMSKSVINEDSLNIFTFPADKFLEDRIINISYKTKNKLALITKIDLIKKSKLLPLTNSLFQMGFENILYFSIYDPITINDLKKFLIQIANKNESSIDTNKDYIIYNSDEFLIKEAIKEIIFENFHEELPYEIEIDINKIIFNKKNEHMIYASLHLKKNAHHIILGKIKQISIFCCNNIKKFLNKDKLHFFLQVKNSK